MNLMLVLIENRSTHTDKLRTEVPLNLYRLASKATENQIAINLCPIAQVGFVGSGKAETWALHIIVRQIIERRKN